MPCGAGSLGSYIVPFLVRNSMGRKLPPLQIGLSSEIDLMSSCALSNAAWRLMLNGP